MIRIAITQEGFCRHLRASAISGSRAPYAASPEVGLVAPILLSEAFSYDESAALQMPHDPLRGNSGRLAVAVVNASHAYNRRSSSASRS